MKTRFSKFLAFLFAFCGTLWLAAPSVLAQSPPGLSVQLSNGYAWLSITGAVGTACAVQYATNLAQTILWLPLTNLTLASNPQLWVDQDCPATGQRFFRAMTTAPLITLNGANPLTNECHAAFADPGAMASDLCAGALAVTTNSTVNSDAVGVYTIKYSATDPSGNSATNTRIVYVVDTTAPLITLNGSNPLTNECHAVFADPGATASDACAGSLGVTTNSTVDPNAVGVYTIKYTATDPSGNSATNTRMVYVVAADCFSAPSGLVSWWPGDGSAGDIAGTDNGTLQGGATANAAGMVAQAFSFDGTNSYVQIPDTPTLKPANLTVEAWVTFSGLDSALAGNARAGDQYIVFKQNSRAYNFEGYSLEKCRIANGDAFMFTVGSASGQEVSLLSVTLVRTSVWYHVAAVRGSNFTQLYVNGQLESQTNVTFAQDYGTLPLYFGSSHVAYWDGKLKGSLDEVSLYNRALSANEIAAIYAADAVGKCKAVIGPSITTPPQSQSVEAGNSATFTVSAAGTAPLSYQWRFNGASIPAASNTSLALTNVQTTNAGSYTVVVTNALGSVTSAVAVLTVVDTTVTNQAPTNMVLIPAGDFTMGDAADGDVVMGSPTHTVYVSAFYMDRYLVTKTLWDEVKSWNGGNGYSYENPGLGKAATHPVQMVNWRDCVKWCNARSQKEGLTPCYYNEAALTTVYKSGTNTPYANWSARGYRLPTEAEWEKAARGGASGHRFAWTNVETISHSQANYRADTNTNEFGEVITWNLSYPAAFNPTFSYGGWPYTSPVGYFAPNGYGLYDMAGNVWQWCWDWLGGYPWDPQTDPHGPTWGWNERVNRGGSWDEVVQYCRVAARGSNHPDLACWCMGLRSVRLPGP